MARRCFSPPLSTCAAMLLAAAALVAGPRASTAQTLRLDDGRTLVGKTARVGGVNENPAAPTKLGGEVATQPIQMVDDELRRVYVNKGRVAQVVDQAPEAPVKITPWQNPAHGAATLVGVGPSLGISPWDEFARRVYEMQTADGPLAVVQGITELTPRYAKVESLLGPPRVITWDMRLATSSIPRDALARIIAQTIPQDDPQQRLQAVRFYIQAGRFHEARDELQRIIEEFPELKDLDNELGLLRQKAAKVLLAELQMRRAAGQHQLVKALLESFPTDETAGETLVEVRQLVSQYEQADKRLERIGQSLQETVGAIEDPDNRGLAAPVAEELVRELSHNNVDRLAPFVQLLDDATLTADEKSALAISGWLLGPEGADKDLKLAMSLVKVRDAVLRYLREPVAAERQAIVDSSLSSESISVERLARLIAHMKPPWHEPEQAATPGGYLELSAPSQTEDGDFNYAVQLPPEYDPYLRYPTLVVLNGAYNSPLAELDFWAGTPPAAAVVPAVAEGQPSDAKPQAADGSLPTPPAPAARRGHAMRHGYITLAIQWQKPHQYEYEFTGREHIAVLACLRDATRRFSIDTDKVFITGHDIGGEAAWDMAQSHPDLWAGAMPFVARADKYLTHYWENARYVPICYVAGELDGRNIAENAPVWDRQLRDREFDVTLVEFRGRGHEPFHDEILELFDWMGRKRRGKPPTEFECKTLRPWDNFFWWLECREFPEQLMMHPTDWSGRRARAAQIEGKLQSDNRLLAKSPAGQTTLWLTPDLVDFSKPIRVTFNGRKLSLPEGGVQPDAVVLLEDVRTRADRQRPFWAKLEAK